MIPLLHGIYAAGAAGDPFFANVTSLLHFDGADTSTTFTDEIGNTWTASGNAQIDTAQSKFGGASGLFDGSGDYIHTANSTDFHFGSGDFTIEFFARINTALTAGNFYGLAGLWGGTTSPSTQRSWQVFFGNVGGTQRIQFSWSTNGTNQTNHITTWSPSTATWYHVAICRDGTSLRTFVDGTQIGSTTTTSDTFYAGTNHVTVGITQNNSTLSSFLYDYDGWMDEMRVTKGVARYTANFTPPTAAFPDS